MQRRCFCALPRSTRERSPQSNTHQHVFLSPPEESCDWSRVCMCQCIRECAPLCLSMANLANCIIFLVLVHGCMLIHTFSKHLLLTAYWLHTHTLRGRNWKPSLVHRCLPAAAPRDTVGENSLLTLIVLDGVFGNQLTEVPVHTLLSISPPLSCCYAGRQLGEFHFVFGKSVWRYTTTLSRLPVNIAACFKMPYITLFFYTQ